MNLQFRGQLSTIYRPILHFEGKRQSHPTKSKIGRGLLHHSNWGARLPTWIKKCQFRKSRESRILAKV